MKTIIASLAGLIQSLALTISGAPVPGSLDPSFTPLLLDDGSIPLITTQPDGKVILANGAMAPPWSESVRGPVRLNAFDGSRDLTFESGIFGWGGEGAGGEDVIFLQIQPDGRILATGTMLK